MILTDDIIVCAVRGNPECMEKILAIFDPLITRYSVVHPNKNNPQLSYVDPDLKRDLQQHLLEAILDFDLIYEGGTPS